MGAPLRGRASGAQTRGSEFGLQHPPPSYKLSAQLWPFRKSRKFSSRSEILGRIFDLKGCFNNGGILDRYNLEECNWYLVGRGQGQC